MSTTTKAPTTDTGVCGTAAGDSRHRRAGQKPCEPCRRAKLDAQHARRAVKARTCRITGEDRQAARLAPPLTSGPLACTEVPHSFRASAGMSTQCASCWGWRDDPRHPVVGGPVVGR